MKGRALAVLFVAALLCGLTPRWAAALCEFGVCTVDGEGASAHLSQAAASALPGKPPGATPGDRYEYRTEIHCSGAEVGGSCLSAMIACAGEPGGGPLHDIFRRIVHADGTATEWVRIGDTCFPPSSAGPQLTYAMIRDAVHRTPWASAAIST